MEYADGRKYEGGWRNNKKHGRGTYLMSGGVTYTGEFRDGKRSGQGRLTW